MALTPGLRLGPYLIECLIGAGGMGEVYKATDTRLDRTVAIKVLPPELASAPGLRERFEREAKAVAALSHPHICTVFDVGRQEDVEFLVMEHLEGETLADRLKQGAIPLEQAVGYAIEIADALDKAHSQGIIHRDLKPGNIMLTATGAKLLDFGLAKLRNQGALEDSGSVTQPAPLTAEGKILGTIQHMSPEQLDGKDTDARTDVFAFGLVLYEMVTGHKAFSGESQARIISAVLTEHPPPMTAVQPLTPPNLDRVVQICLAKDPDERPQRMGDLVRELAWNAEGPLPTRYRRVREAELRAREASLGPAVPAEQPDPEETLPTFPVLDSAGPAGENVLVREPAASEGAFDPELLQEPVESPPADLSIRESQVDVSASAPSSAEHRPSRSPTSYLRAVSDRMWFTLATSAAVLSVAIALWLVNGARFTPGDGGAGSGALATETPAPVRPPAIPDGNSVIGDANAEPSAEPAPVAP